jgi:protein-S-isoprenylcysteine O-methyltransferase Ste14
MPVYLYILLAVGWILWLLPFPLSGWNRSAPAKRDKRWRWGLLLQIVAYCLLWQGHFWLRSPALWQVALAVLCFLLASLLSWTSTRALGKHLRFDAALSHDHELVRSGPYGMIRHPIYTSMLCILLGTGVLITPPLLFLAALILFLIGTEIRVRAEDGLLASRFGDEFLRYRQTVSAYVPFVR